jgi:hypothetical protein
MQAGSPLFRIRQDNVAEGRSPETQNPQTDRSADNAKAAFDPMLCTPTMTLSAPTRSLWNGYEISLGPTGGQPAVPEEIGCTATIHNQAGNVVFRTTGYTVGLESLTGTDFDGDGEPDVVLSTDRGGGNRGFWVYDIVSLSPVPHKLFDVVADGEFGIQFEKDANGNIVIWRQTTESSSFMVNAYRPSAEKVSRVRQGKLVDATPEFCSRIFAGETKGYGSTRALLTAENLDRLRSIENINDEVQQVVSALLSRALQRVFCHRFDEASDDLDLLPAVRRQKMTAEFIDWIKSEYPEFAARLRRAGNK